MKIQILDVAKADLIEGYRFYEGCETGLGDYFLANLYLDIDSLTIFGGLILATTGILTALSASASLLPSTTL